MLPARPKIRLVISQVALVIRVDQFPVCGDACANRHVPVTAVAAVSVSAVVAVSVSAASVLVAAATPVSISVA
jgi:hypothetical protein